MYLSIYISKQKKKAEQMKDYLYFYINSLKQQK